MERKRNFREKFKTDSGKTFSPKRAQSFKAGKPEDRGQQSKDTSNKKLNKFIEDSKDQVTVKTSDLSNERLRLPPMPIRTKDNQGISSSRKRGSLFVAKLDSRGKNSDDAICIKKIRTLENEDEDDLFDLKDTGIGQEEATKIHQQAFRAHMEATKASKVDLYDDDGDDSMKLAPRGAKRN